jgi:putative DNA primase/helicase
MATLEQVIDQMTGSGLPSLPVGHPLLDGKIHRFGRGKKAWYVLRELTLSSGRQVVTGAYGIWQGQDQNAVPVTIDWEGVTPAERAEAERKQAEQQRLSDERKARAAELAANRARWDWRSAAEASHSYLERKRVGTEGTRVMASGQLLVPARKYTRAGATLAALQRIEPDGSKRFSMGADMVGACCLLGTANDLTPLIEIGEGYATCETVRMATDFDTPTMVAFNAGNLLAVAQQLRRDFPAAHLLFLADDDMRLVPRLAEALLADFDAEWLPVIDGADHEIESKGGDIVRVRATWRKDGTGTDYIEADIRAGRQVSIRKFENAGLSRSRAAARVVGNASVVSPVFVDRVDDKWSDFNDLYLAESLATVRDQVQAARSRALSASEAPHAVPEIIDDVPSYLDEAPAPSAAPEPAELGDVAAAIRVPTLEVLLSHFSLIYPTTDVWDSLRRQRLKKSAFTAWVGKELAASWEKDPKRRTILRDSLPTLVGGRAVEGGAGGGKLGEMLDNLTLLRGTETVWDAIGQQVMSLGAVRADYTAELTGKWQEHAQRKTIEARNLVFDPTQTADPVSHVNIFLGWPLQAKHNAELIKPILALLASLCDAEDKTAECVEWILRWLAYPLQHPGAKMQTALLMFGEKQGTGKSLFFQDVMLPVYGDYGTVASQHQLDSTFTAWRSRKLFVLFEEVLSRDDKYSHNGTLKYMITGKSMSINQKNLPERDERNHMNSVFLSNEPQPIPIELEDRRFMVIEARRKQDPAFYAAVQQSIAQGGIEAFYDFLLTLPLDDFNEHTKPPMTLAKERVIEFGLAGWMSFHRAWKDGYLDAPYCSCLSEDLYIIYKRWCDKSGEKPLTLCKFAGLMGGREHKAKKAVAVESKHKKSRMVFVVDNPDYPDGLEEQIAKFRKLGDVRADRALQG